MMNIRNQIFLSLKIIGLCLIIACGDDEDATPLRIEPSDVLASGPDWQITTFIKEGNDRTSDYQDYSFELFSNGDFLINFGGINDSFGRWEIIDDGVVLQISLSNATPPTDEIEGVWNVVSKSETSLRLVSADGAGKEFRLNK